MGKCLDSAHTQLRWREIPQADQIHFKNNEKGKSLGFCFSFFVFFSASSQFLRTCNMCSSHLLYPSIFKVGQCFQTLSIQGNCWWSQAPEHTASGDPETQPAPVHHPQSPVRDAHEHGDSQGRILPRITPVVGQRHQEGGATDPIRTQLRVDTGEVRVGLPRSLPEGQV